MGLRHRMKPAKPKPGPKPRPPAPDDLVSRAELHLIRLLDSCEATLAEGMATPQLIRESQGIAKALMSIEAHRDRRERQALADASKISHAVVMRYLRQLDEPKRRQVVRELQALDNEGSILG